MPRAIKILHIDPDYQTNYFIFRPHSTIRTPVPLDKAIALLKKEDFDLIISEPHHKAILKKDYDPGPSGRPLLNDNAGREETHGHIGEIRQNRYS